MRSKLWYILAIVACALLPLAGCSGGGGGQAKQTQKGVEVTVAGKVAVGKSSAKSAFLSATSAAAANNVFVYDAQDGTQLGSAAIASDGSFSNLAFTLPAAKTVLVFKAIVAQGTFRSVVPIDLSNPPATGVITGSQPINIAISQDSTNVATTVSAMLGLSGVLGDTGQTLASASKSYVDAAQQVLDNGGQVLAYSTDGLALTGSLSSASLLPARDASTLTADDLNNIALSGKVISAYIPNKKPVVNFQVVNKATGKGISGLRTFALHIAQFQPEKEGSNSYWLNYILSSSAPNRPTSDAATTFNADGSVKSQGYTVIDHGDGTYTVTFGKDVTSVASVPYDANLVHRIGISVRSVAVPGGYAGPINPATGAVSANFAVRGVTNLIYDFTPATGAMLADTNGKQIYARDIVTMDACNQCHDKLGFSGGHFASRPDTKLCVMCHTKQNIDPNNQATTNGEFTSFIHKIHMGEELPTTETILGVDINEVTYPQDVRNCTMCHKGADVDNWKKKPSRKACGSCHSDVDFTTHKGGQTSDQSCAACHTGGIPNVEVSAAHRPVQDPDPNSPEMGGTNTHTYAGYLPAAGAVIPGAATVSWDVKSVAVDANQHPSITFRFIKNGAPVVFNTYAAGSVTELMDGFVGSPSVYFAFSVPQDGIAAPADFNATASAYIKGVWNGSVTTSAMTGPDANGYYTITINNAIIPASAKMLTGGVGYTYGSATPPLTQIDLPAYPFNATTRVGGLLTTVPNTWKVATGFTGRRAIVSNAKCNACHVALGIAPTFHSGQRNDAQTCTFCHNVNKINNGWAINEKDFVHALHAGAKRTNKFSWEAAAGDAYWKITYPGYLRNCEQCHLPGTYDFSAKDSAAAVPNLLPSTAANGATPATINSIVTGDEALPGTYYSPFVSAGTTYGSEFKFKAADGTSTEAAATTPIISPITAACFSCHDDKTARAHMVQNGGSIYEARSTALGKTETCLVCHGTAQNTVNTTVPSIKAVHRWW